MLKGHYDLCVIDYRPGLKDLDHFVQTIDDDDEKLVALLEHRLISYDVG